MSMEHSKKLLKNTENLIDTLKNDQRFKIYNIKIKKHNVYGFSIYANITIENNKINTTIYMEKNMKLTLRECNFVLDGVIHYINTYINSNIKEANVMLL